MQKVKYPAGLDIGAETPEEIALSILTEIVQRMRSDWKGVSLEPAVQVIRVESIDPICNMTVDVAESRYHSTYNGTTFHFCCLACKEKFEQSPHSYAHSVHLAASGLVVLHGQHLRQNGHGHFGGSARSNIQSDGRPDTGQVGIAEALLS